MLFRLLAEKYYWEPGIVTYLTLPQAFLYLTDIKEINNPSLSRRKKTFSTLGAATNFVREQKDGK